MMVGCTFRGGSSPECEHSPASQCSRKTRDGNRGAIEATGTGGGGLAMCELRVGNSQHKRQHSNTLVESLQG